MNYKVKYFKKINCKSLPIIMRAEGDATKLTYLYVPNTFH